MGKGSSLVIHRAYSSRVLVQVLVSYWCPSTNKVEWVPVQGSVEVQNKVQLRALVIWSCVWAAQLREVQPHGTVFLTQEVWW